MTVVVEFVKSHGPHQAGEVIEVCEGFASTLIKKGLARPCLKELRKPPRDKMMRRYNTK